MEKLINKINESCCLYFSDELDDLEFINILNEIPEEQWQEKDSALLIVKELVENEDLFEVSLNQDSEYSKFVCELLPEIFWHSTDNILGAAKIIFDYTSEYYEYASCNDIEPVFSHITPTMWENSDIATAAANFVIERINMLEDLNCISDLIPESVWKDEQELRWAVLRLFNEDERNMNYLSLFPKKSWEHTEIILLILSCLQDALENDRSWGTMYPNFGGNNKEYLEDFLSFVPDKFKSDSEFIYGLLVFDYFSDGLSVVYDWMDQSMWEDKDVVLKALESDCTAIIRIPEQMANNEDISEYIEENIDFEWDLKYVPQENIPQWIKDWNK